MNLKSIRWRLPLSYIGIALVAALASGALTLAALRGYYQQRERAYLVGNAVHIALAAEQLLQAQVPGFVLADQVTAWSFLLQSRVQLYDARDNLLADSGTPDTRQVVMVSNPAVWDVRLDDPTAAGAPFTTTLPGGGPESYSGIFLLPAVGVGVSDVVGPDEVVGAAAGGAFGDVRVVTKCVPKAGAPCAPEIASANFITGTGPVTQPVAVSMFLGDSFYGFEIASNEIGNRRSSERVMQVLHDETGDVSGRLVLSEGPAYGAEIVLSVARAWSIASLAAVLIAGAAGWLASRRITAPVLRLTEVTKRMAAGDLAVRSMVDSGDEFGALGRSFDQMAGQIEGMVGTLRRFAADAAHELNTPITALRTDLELARETQDADERLRLLERASGQLTRLQGLVHGMLSLSRMEGSAHAAVREPVDLRILAQSLGEVYASRAEQNEISFELELPDHPVTVPGDPSQLHTALANLLDNAIKFTPGGGKASLRLDEQESCAVLTVSDTGIGIPPDDLPRMFERFHRGRNTAAYPGNGLGLAIVRAIVDAHSGEISATSTGQGTSFVLKIPLG